MPAPTQRFTAAEITSLEHAFASEPTSDAYRPLAEAYLALGRYMEAMVVCKKGVKAHPDDPSPRVLLARVYADQGKDRKALEELQAVLQSWPAFASANRMAGSLMLRMGDRDAGIAALQRALDAAPGDPETIALLQQNGVSVAAATPAPAARAPAARAAAPRAPAAATPRATGAVPPGAAAPPVAAAQEQPTPTPPPVRTASSAYADALAEKYATREFSLESLEKGRGVKKKSKTTAVVTVTLAAVVVTALGGWAAFTHQRKTRIETIDKLLKETQGLLERDAWPSYKEAAAKSGEVVGLDAKVLSGHAYLAWVDAVRWVEHAEGDAVRDEAQKAVGAGKALGTHSHLVAAEAFLRCHSNDAGRRARGAAGRPRRRGRLAEPVPTGGPRRAPDGRGRSRRGARDADEGPEGEPGRRAARAARSPSSSAGAGSATSCRRARHVRPRAAHPEGPRPLAAGQVAHPARPRASSTRR